MSAGTFLETDVGASLRCGRCADLLPDETLTFCKSCGVPFSQAHPTNSYTLLVEHHKSVARRFQKYKTWGLTFGLFAGFWIFYGLFWTISQKVQVSALRPVMREVQFYLKDFEQLPMLDNQIKHESIFIAQRAFEDHFGLTLNDISIHDDRWPQELESVFRETQSELDESNLKEVAALFTIPAMKLSFWETKVFPAMNLYRVRDPQSPLRVVISNLPVFASHDKDSSVEVRHLAGSGLVTGLGHPGLIFISTYRLHNDVPLFSRDRPVAESFSEQARYLGEYGIAHELGHALLGLSDYVTPAERYLPVTLSRATKKEIQKSEVGGANRSIASLHAESVSSDVSQCIMHTDPGGGARAWDNLKKRQLGVTSTCSAYEEMTHAFSLRLQALALLKVGDREDAEKLHARALELAKPLGQEWLTAEWKQEHKVFLSFFKRLWLGLFMIQSRND